MSDSYSFTNNMSKTDRTSIKQLDAEILSQYDFVSLAIFYTLLWLVKSEATCETED